MKYQTLQDLFLDFQHRATCGVTFIEGSNEEYTFSYKDIYERSLGLLGSLSARGIRPGDELIIQLERNADFVSTFWACMAGGIIPVPLRVGNNEEHHQKVFNVWKVLKTPYLISSSRHLERLHKFASESGQDFDAIKSRSLTYEACSAACEAAAIPRVTENDIAYLQFSSGSTGEAKGVMLTHRNLTANIEAILEGIDHPREGDIFLSWMPLTHDMGLIGYHLTPAYQEWQHYIMPTELFIRRPLMWLEKISQHRITFTASPNFGFSYVLEHFNPRQEYAWRLDSLRIITNGAEPISPELCEIFSEAFKPLGLPDHTIFPVYGLAEASLAVTFSIPRNAIHTVTLDRSSLRIGDAVKAGVPGQGLSVVNVGTAVTHCSVRIVDEHDILLDNNTIGQIQIKGDNVTCGYYNSTRANEKLFSADGWLNTGDLGFIEEGMLFVTGRIKDVIFVGGQNVYPHDLEQILIRMPGVEAGKLAIGGHYNERLCREEIIAFILFKGDLVDFVPVADRCKQALSDRTGLSLDHVIPVRKIPKTTSGKVQRFKLLLDYGAGKFEEVQARLLKVMPVSGSGIPGGPEEAALLQIGKAVLNIPSLGTEDNFFAMGGNSIKAGELVNKIYHYFRVNVPVNVVFEKPTVKALAEVITRLPKEDDEPVTRVRQAPLYPVSTVQRRLYYQWQRDTSSVAYNVPTAFSIQGDLQVAWWQEACRYIVRRHESLRTSFRLENETPVQVVADEVACNLEFEETGGSALNLANHVMPFDLHDGPLFRFKLFQTARHAYLFFIDVHHIVADGISVTVLMNDLLSYYHGLQKVNVAPWQYKDYVGWEDQRMNRSTFASGKEFWVNLLGETDSALEMPADFVRPAFFDTRGATLRFTLPDECIAPLRELALRAGVTMQMLFLSVYKILLSKYSGAADIVVGIPSSGRTRPEFSDVVGMLVNNLPVRSYPVPEKPFLYYLGEVGKLSLDALNHQDYLFGDLLDDLGRSKDPSRNVVFDTMFNYLNLDLQTKLLTHNDLNISHHVFDPGFSKYDLSLEVSDKGDTFDFAVEYATSLFTERTIRQFNRHYIQLIRSVLQSPGALIKDLVMTGWIEQEAWASFNDSQQQYPASRTVSSLFEEQVMRCGSRTAITSGDASLTYAQLGSLVNRLAVRLRSKGIGRQSRVAIVASPSMEFVVCALAVWKAGAAYVPVDADYPLQRKEDIISDSQCALILMQASHMDTRHRISLSGVEYMMVSLEELRRDDPCDVWESACEPGDLAYVIYTSGSTGKPKGVMVAHQSLTNYVWWASKTYVGGRDVVFPLFSSVAFDLTVTSLYVPLITGNSIRVYQDDTELAVMQVFRENETDIVKLTPSHLRIVDSMDAAYLRNSRIRTLVVGGENLDAALARSIAEKWDNPVIIYNEYGPTEATVGCMICAYDPSRDRQGSVPIGKPADNARIFLVDEHMNMVPEGITGEILIAGDVLAKGYLFNEKLTSQQFITHERIGKAYRTGDLARMLPGGIMEYQGRKDTQVKINGYRVELDEIRNHLVSLEGITDAVVIAGPAGERRKKMDAYYTSEKKIGATRLRDLLALKLPHFMMPASFTWLEKMPLTQNGKIDTSRLPEPEVVRADDQQVADALERMLMEVFGEVLRVKSISPADDFIAMGGDSIKAVQITSRLLDRGYALKVNDILRHQTIGRIRSYLQPVSKHYDQGTVSGTKKMTPVEKWFFEHHRQAPQHYNQSVTLKLREGIDRILLERSFEIVIRHHDGLRINYHPSRRELFFNDHHLQAAFSIPAYDISGTDEAGLMMERAEAMKGSFDLQNDLLLKAAWFTTGGGDLLFITAHHLVIDGLSWRILLEDLKNIYLALEQGEDPALPLKTASLQEWSLIQYEHLASSITAGELSYWQQNVADPVSLPQDYHTDNWSAADSAACNLECSPDKTRILESIAHHQYHTDLSTLLLVALHEALHQWTGHKVFDIEMEGHGRMLPSVNVSRTIGWFTSLYPMKLTCEGKETGDRIRFMKERIRAIPEGGFNFGGLKYFTDMLSVPERMAEVRFNYLGSFDAEISNEMFTHVTVETGRDTSPSNPLTAKIEINALVSRGTLRLQTVYSSAAFADETMVRFMTAFEEMLDRIIACEETGEIHFSSSDFETASLDQHDLDALFK